MHDHRLDRGVAWSRDADRELAASLPFLLDAGLSDLQWPDHHAWDLRRAPELGSSFDPTELYALAWRMRRVLVTDEPAYLDDVRFPVATCPGVIVVGSGWREVCDRFLVLVVGLLGPFARLYQGVKLEGRDGHYIRVTAPVGRRGARASRRFTIDPAAMPHDRAPDGGALHRRRGAEARADSPR